MVYKGPEIAHKISGELIDILKNKGVKNISEVIGIKNWSWLIIKERLYTFVLMSKKCELTGKIPLKGHRVSHANNKTKRKFLPNLKKVKFKSDVLKKNIRLTVSNSALRSVDKKGSFDKFLKNAKNINLSQRLKRIRKTILAKTA